MTCDVCTMNRGLGGGRMQNLTEEGWFDLGLGSCVCVPGQACGVDELLT